MLTYSTRARGGVVHAIKLAERLRRKGADVRLYSLARDDDPSAREGYYRNVEVPFEIISYRWHPDLMTRLENMITGYTSNLPLDVDVYHAQDCVGGTALMRMKNGGEISAPIFRTIHHVDDFAEPMLFEFEKRAVANADHRFVVSQYWKDVLNKEYGYDSVITYNGLDAEDFATIPKKKSIAPTVLFVGGLEPRKGLEHLFLAMESVSRRHPTARLVTVAKAGFRGVDNAAWFDTLADRAGISDRVTMLDSVDQKDLLQLYADSDLLVLPSRNEGWGLSLMEAMACGKPVVASRVGGIPELVRDGIEGILVEHGDVRSLAGAISRILDDSSLAEKMGQAGRDRIKPFSWDSAADTVLAEYQRAMI